MANFQPNVLKSILNNEGGYVNDPDDNGGETWAGVARNINPRWAGWAIVDRIKVANPVAASQAKQHSYHALNVLLYADTALASLVASIYLAEYWNVNSLGAIIDQQLAANVCDCGVNCGTYTGAKMLQNAFNAVHSLRAPLVVDGKIGPATLAAINSGNAYAIYYQYNILRKAYYDAIIARNPSQVKYKAAWYSRIIPYKP